MPYNLREYDGAWLTTRWTSVADVSWGPPGSEVCVVQVPLGEDGRQAQDEVDAAADTGTGALVGDDGRLRHPLLAAPAALCLWRAPTDNDRIGGMATAWAEAGVDRLERRLVTLERDDATVRIVDEVTTGAGHVIRHERTVMPAGDGGVRVEEAVTIPPDITDLARVGLVLETHPGLEALRWFGTGPHETYPDRKRGGVVAIHESTVTDQTVPYIRPQENGGHADVHWLELTDPATGRGSAWGSTRRDRSPRPTIGPSTWPAATHHPELVPRPETIVHLDAAHRGLGTASCGPDTLPAYLVGPGEYRWAWTLRDIPARDDA